MSTDVLKVVLPELFGCLQDRDDDVRAVSAAAILPVTDIMVNTQPAQVLPTHSNKLGIPNNRIILIA